MIMHSRQRLVTALLAGALLSSSPLWAEEPTTDDSMSYSSIVETMSHKEGFLTFYRDQTTGETLFAINESQLNQPMIYLAQSLDGIVEAGHFRGNFRETRVIEFRRYFDRIDIVALNPRFQFDPNNPLSRAANANISQATLATLPIIAEEEGQILLSADRLFIGDALHKLTPTLDRRSSGAGFMMGELLEHRSRFSAERVYPRNVDVVIDYVFLNNEPQESSAAQADARITQIRLQHSLIALPENDYQPRADDARIGYFTQSFDRMTDSSWAPYGDVINRWHLEKKHPEQDLSEPVEPIVWWIENTTPHEWRKAIRQGVEGWNIAFEAAGFKNALVVKEQPDDAEWESGDINYNVLRWTSSPQPLFGGYGPSLANPLTGEIIAANIMLEHIFLSNVWLTEQVFAPVTPTQQTHTHIINGQPVHCSAAHSLQQGLMMARATYGLPTGEAFADNERLQQGLRHLVMHEIGHTLGLNHNMKSHSLWDNEQIHDKSLTKGVLSGSVMDYAPINLAPVGKPQGDYYSYLPGPYDIWAIEYGYSPALADPEQESQRLERILQRSHQPELAFANDADDMRFPGVHIDPRAMIGAHSSDPITYATQRFELIKHTYPQLLQTARVPGQSHQQLLISANVLFNHYLNQANVVSRYIGGIYVERAVVGQDPQVKPFTPVALADQQRAMRTLANYVFAPDVLQEMMPLLNYMQPQRRGFARYGINEDPKPHQRLFAMQQMILDHLLHPNVTMRLSDSRLYGNQYSVNQMLSELTNAIFVDARQVNSISQMLQVSYVQRLIVIANLDKENESEHDFVTRSEALAQLHAIRKMRLSRHVSDEVKNHYQFINQMIDGALK
ncbi:zinc-dependent metalloprotease [Vibrio metschnikovii]|nr:zinc-dependent metalloprotease [Vibrio metschnikovii]EKO3688852.1 zinc-dependent metalloprotease [Vibrio metschnikovii]